MNLKRTLLPTLLLLSLSLFLNAAPPVEEGKSIFQARCAACHNINKTMTGPALAGVDQRRSLDWIINFVHSSQTVIKNGDKDAAVYSNHHYVLDILAGILCAVLGIILFQWWVKSRVGETILKKLVRSTSE